MTAAESRAAPSADGVDFVDKDDAGLILFRHIEKVAHTAGADADVHFDEVGAGNGEERHARLSRDGFREQGFTRSRRAYQEHAAGNPRAEVGELFGSLQKFHDFLQFFFFFFRAGDVRETDFEVALYVRLGLADTHDLTAAARRRTH